MKNCLFVSLLGLVLFSCTKPAITINLDSFNNSYEKAFYSQFQIKDDKVYLANAQSTFDGKLSFIEFDGTVKEITIDDGEVETVIVRDLNKKVLAEGKREGKTFHLTQNLNPTIFEYGFNKAEFTLTNFSNKAFVTRPLSEQEGRGTKKGDKEIEGKVSVRVNRQKNLIITEIVYKKQETSLRKSVTFSKHLTDSTDLEIVFEEYFDIIAHTSFGLNFNQYADRYLETVSIRNPKENMKLKTSWSFKNDLRVVSEQDSYNGKNCGVSEVLVSGISPLAMGESECVNDGLLIVNELLKKKINREALISRFLAKNIHNRFLTQLPDDIDFYF